MDRSGDAAVALAEPFKVVLSEKEARRYFAETPLEDIMGRQVVYNDSLRLTVSGIVKDWTENSDFDFKDFISASTIEKSFLKNNISVGQWSNWDISYQVFAKLGENVQPKQLAGVFEVFSKNYLKPDVAKPSIGMQSLSGIHFNNEIADEFSRKASLPTLYGLMAIAIFILVIAAINFINLSTAQSVQRAKEIGIRKVLGSSRGNLVFQFLSETFLFTVFAVLIAVTMINPLLKLFYTFIPAGVQFRPGMQTLAFLAGITLIVSLLAGFYPAKVLSSYLPVLSLKGANASNTNQKGYLRKSLIVFQFTVSLVFIIGTLTVGNQINFMLNKDLGFKKEAIINIQTDWKEPVSKRDLFIQQIRSLPAVSMTSISQKPAAVTMQNGTVVQYNGKQKTEVETQNIMADENFLPLYGIRLLAGSNYAHSDTINQLLVNETATKSLGFKKPEDAIGKSLFIGISDRPNSSQVFPITGVMADFHSTSLHDPIKPLFIAPGLSMAREISIKLSFAKDPAKLKATLMSLEKTWKQIYPNKAFEYHFFDESIARFYDKEQKTAQVINIAMAIAIFISCMGLFGLVAFTTAQRTKEIGIRKILGASVSGIATMICKDFVVLVLLAILIASPVAWYFMSKWLQNFPYHISVSWWIFPVAGLMAITIALLTVGFQAIKASVANPVNSLRTE